MGHLQGPLGLGVLALWQLVQHVCRLVHPAALLARFWPHLAERLPEPESAIGGGEFRRDRQATPLQIEQQRAPVMGALARAVGETDQLLPTSRRGADDNEDALRIVLQTRLQMNAVGPDIDVALGGKVALVPALVLVDPDLLQPRDRRGRQARSILAEQGGQRFLEVAGRNALQVEDRNQHLQALRAPGIGRQDRGRKANTLGSPAPVSSARRRRGGATLAK